MTTQALAYGVLSEKMTVIHEEPRHSYVTIQTHHDKRSLPSLHDSHQDASRIVPIELREDQLPQVVNDLENYSTLEVVDYVPYSQRQIPDDPVPVVLEPFEVPAPTLPKAELDNNDTGSYFDDHIDDDDDENDNEWDEESDIDWNDEELLSREYMAKFRRRRDTDGLNSTSKALQILGLEQPSPTTPRRSASLHSPISCMDNSNLEYCESITKHAKARQILGMEPLEQESTKEELCSAPSTESQSVVAELPADADEYIPDYHDSLRALQTIDGGTQPWTPSQAGLAISVGVAGGAVGVATVASNAYTASQAKRSADANIRSAYAAELSAEAAVTQVILNARDPVAGDRFLSRGIGNDTEGPQWSDISSESSNTQPNPRVVVRSFPPVPCRSPNRPVSSGVKESMQNVKLLQRQLLLQANQNQELERRRRNVEAFKRNLAAGKPMYQRQSHPSQRLMNDAELDRRLRQERQLHHTNSTSSREADDETVPPEIPPRSRSRRSNVHVAHMVARGSRASDHEMVSSSASEFGTDIRDGTKMGRLNGTSLQHTAPGLTSGPRPSSGGTSDARIP